MFENYDLFQTLIQLRPSGVAEPADRRKARSFIVPPGRWHRPAVDEPGALLALTPRTGTEHERAAA